MSRDTAERRPDAADQPPRRGRPKPPARAAALDEASVADMLRVVRRARAAAEGRQPDASPRADD